jgi:hypothetical protein
LIFIKFIFSFNFISTFGTTIFSNQSFIVSFILFSKLKQFFILQVSEISQIKTVFLGIGLFNFEEIIEAPILTSIPGSSTFIHLTILT